MNAEMRYFKNILFSKLDNFYEYFDLFIYEYKKLFIEYLNDVFFCFYKHFKLFDEKSKLTKVFQFIL